MRKITKLLKIEKNLFKNCWKRPKLKADDHHCYIAEGAYQREVKKANRSKAQI